MFMSENVKHKKVIGGFLVKLTGKGKFVSFNKLPPLANR